MIRLITGGLLAALSFAASASVQSVATPGVWDLFSGSKKTGSYASIPACVAAAESAASAAKKSAKFSCRNSVTVAVTFKADPLPPPPGPEPIPSPVTDHSGHGPAVDMSKLKTGWAGIGFEWVLPTSEQPLPTDDGAFRTVCEFTHMAKDDPIVFPAQPGKSHLHAFFGNPTTNAFSTIDSIMAAPTSACMGGTVNHTAYWQPAIIDTLDGSPVAPDDAILYYKTGAAGNPKALIQAFPAGLRIVAGDATSFGPQDGISSYSCVRDGDPSMDGSQLYGKSIPNCPAGSRLWAAVKFPNCWDGKNLDSPNHKSHMSYVDWPTQKCPAAYPVPLPEIVITARYQVKEKDSPLRWRLASDMYDPALPAGYSLHADWLGGWKKDIMDAWVKGCDQASRDCHAHLLGDGRMLGGPR
jgi:hypothetical protein